jgi:hypothetical protein
VGWSLWIVFLSLECSMACSSSGSSTSSNIDCRFYPQIRVGLVAATGGGAALLLLGVALLPCWPIAGVCSHSLSSMSVETCSSAAWGTTTSVTSSSCGLISPIANCLIASQGGSSFPTTLESTCSIWELLDS